MKMIFTWNSMNMTPVSGLLMESFKFIWEICLHVKWRNGARLTMFGIKVLWLRLMSRVDFHIKQQCKKAYQSQEQINVSLKTYALSKIFTLPFKKLNIFCVTKCNKNWLCLLNFLRQIFFTHQIMISSTYWEQ